MPDRDPVDGLARRAAFGQNPQKFEQRLAQQEAGFAKREAELRKQKETLSAVADAIKLLMTKKRSELAAAGEKGRIWIQTNRSYKALAHKFIDAVLNSDAREMSSQSTQIQK